MQPQDKQKFLIPPPEIARILPGSRMIASLSGGSDSLALTAALHQWQAQFPFQLEAVHFIHGIRSAEIGEAECALCRRFCEKIQIPLTIATLDVPAHRKPGESMEECARNLRLAYWQKRANGEPDFFIASGHHADDRMENLLIRLFRGSNTSGLTSLRPVGSIGKLRVLRPLLAYHKDELRAWLKELDITDWAEDATNAEQDTLRNYLRNAVLPDLFRNFPAAQSGLLSAADALEKDAAFLESVTDSAWKTMNPERTQDWTVQEPAIRARLMRRFLAGRLGTDQLPDRQMLRRFESTLNNAQISGETRDIPLRNSNIILTVHGDTVSLHEADSHTPEPSFSARLWNWRDNPEITICGQSFQVRLIDPEDVCAAAPDTAFFDANLLPETLLIDSIHPGDRMTLFGSGANKKLKKLLIDAKIPQEERRMLAVIRDPRDSGILWLPGIRNSNLFPCKPGTKKAAVFFWKKI